MRKAIASLCLCAVFSMGSVRAEELVRSAEAKPSKWWKISSFVLAAAVAADVQSSWGRQELNPLLRNGNGRFGVQGFALKSVLVGGTLGAQYFLLKKHPGASKYAMISNFAIAGVLGGAAITNHRNASAPPSYLVNNQ